MYRYRHPRQDERFIWAAPFVGGLLGGFLGSALVTPRPYPPRPYPPYPVYPYYPPYQPYPNYYNPYY